MDGAPPGDPASRTTPVHDVPDREDGTISAMLRTSALFPDGSAPTDPPVRNAPGGIPPPVPPWPSAIVKA